jgi:predicted Zn-dependent protease
MGENDAAQQTIAEASTPEGRDTMTQAIQAALLLRNGKASEALSLLRDATASTIERPGFLAALEGRALAALGREQEAKLAFAEARERDPNLAAMLRRMRQGLIENHLDTTAAEVDAVLAELEP